MEAGGKGMEATASTYRRQEAAYSVPLEKSLMLEKNWHLLLCWNHKVGRGGRFINLSKWSIIIFCKMVLV